MKTFNLSAEPRTDLGKKATKALRASKKIPAVLNGGKLVELPYTTPLEPGEKLVEIANGRGLLTTDIQITEEGARKLLYSPDIYAIELDLNGRKRMAVLKDVQFDPIKDTPLHIDLLEVSEDKPVVMEVPVKIEGHAAGVKAGGKLKLMMRKAKVKAPYTLIPERLVVNVDALEVGHVIAIGDLHFEGLELINPKDAGVVAVIATRQSATGDTAAAEEAAE